MLTKFGRFSFFFVYAVSLCILFLSGCKKDPEEERQKSVDMVTVRTLGLAFLEENKLPEAEEQFLQLIEIEPEEALGYANLGLVYMRMGKYPEAETHIKKALDIDPGAADIRLNLAEIYEQDGRLPEAITLLEKSLDQAPDHAKSIYKLARLYNKSDTGPDPVKSEQLLSQVVEKLPANITARLELIENLLRSGKADAARKHLEQLRQQMPELPKESVEFFNKALALTAAGNSREAIPPVMIFHNFMKVTPLYQASILDLKGPGGPLTGSPTLTFSRDITLQAEAQSILETLRFTDATETAGLKTGQIETEDTHNTWERFRAILTVGDYEGDRDQDVFFSIWDPKTEKSRQFLFSNDFGRFKDIAAEAGIGHAGRDVAALFADVDNNGYLDLYIANSEKNALYRNVALGKFENVAGAAGVADSKGTVAAVFADFDHEADLDLYLLNSTENRLYRNNSDGTFTERAAQMGLSGASVLSRDAAFGDFDEDGDLDLFVVNENAGNILYTNLRQGRFQDITEKSGLKNRGQAGAVTAGDYNNDGFLDLFVTGLVKAGYHLYQNQGDGSFAEDTRSQDMLKTLSLFIGLDTRFFDFDNDGFLDLLVAGEAPKNGSGLYLFHNDGAGVFENVSELLPDDIGAINQIAVADYNEDGDLDIFLTETTGRLRLLRNDGGNVNKYLKVQLVGLRTGSGKNNHFGIGAKLEVRAGDLYQMRSITEPSTHFGLGQRLKADVVRIVWPNGVPQNLFYPGSDQDLIEQQTLKGSCAFLYTWNGEEFEFVTDVMWRSALGMPLGIMGGETAYAFPNSSNDYFRISGDKLKARNGAYTLHLTEELWETAYFDQVRLIAVDHPDSIDVFIDERFVPPPAPALEIHTVSEKHTPAAAFDDDGNDLLPAIRFKDAHVISTLKPAEYQGITKMHDLILDLGQPSDPQNVRLFLNGWIFPTDASINVAISQSDRVRVAPPVLQVPNKNGQWQTVENIGFPMGKDKTVVVDLSGKFLTDDYRARIRTNMEIYWDYIFFCSETPQEDAVHATTLTPDFANLHYRGFSKLFRKGGRYGPHWFDYSEVSTEQKWRDLIGDYTRYGDVLPLLQDSDNKLVIINAGDEMTLEFDAGQAPDLPPGWSRDFLIYTDGWIKDGDLNTGHGKTVEPLPYHGMTRYPYGPDEAYPDDTESRVYLKKYNTRKVTVDRFKKGLD
ncbi:MAG: FG-GAP-like repeat-containing protein [bacterium]